jgi:hypothetical protein
LTVLIHNLEGYLIGPLVLGRSVELHPLAVLVIAVGGVIAGIVGVPRGTDHALVTTTVRFYRRMDPEDTLPAHRRPGARRPLESTSRSRRHRQHSTSHPRCAVLNGPSTGRITLR